MLVIGDSGGRGGGAVIGDSGGRGGGAVHRRFRRKRRGVLS